MSAAVRWISGQRESALGVVIILLLIVIGLRAPNYLAPANLLNVLINASFLMLLVLGQLIVLLTRGIDLSPASVLAFTGMFLAKLSHAVPETSALVYILLGLLMGTVLGALNGTLVAGAGIPPIIATLGTMTVYRGLIFLLSGGAWISEHEMSVPFKSFPTGVRVVLPNIVWVTIICAFAAWLFLRYTRAGRALYAVGGNPAAARLAGVSIKRAEFLAYCISGAIAGLCGYLWTARFAIAYTQAAEGREFAIIAACVIGGVTITGGKGTVAGVILGALFLSIIESSLPFVRVNPFLQMAISGFVILIAVAVNSRSERSTGRQILPPEAAPEPRETS